MELTETSKYKGHNVSGYMLNVGLNEENQRKIAEINHLIKDKFGDVILDNPPHALHITLLDWVAPLVDYGRDWDELYEEVFPLSDKVFTELSEKLPSFKVRFDAIKVSPAAIYIVGHDDGQFQSLRKDFVDQAGILPGTKQPPEIIHSTLARFDAQVEFAEIKNFVKSLSIDMEETIDSFRLIHEKKTPMLTYEVLKLYPLARK